MSEDITDGIVLETENTTPEILEPMIFKLLFQKETVRSTLLPYLEPNVFAYEESSNLIKEIDKFEEEFNTFPTIKDLRMYSQNTKIDEYLDMVVKSKSEDYNESHLLSSIEHYIRKSLFSKEVNKMIINMQDPNFKIKPEDTLPEILRDVFSFSFDNSVGMNLFSEEGFEQMFDFFHQKNQFIPTGIGGLDEVLAGGFHAKSLSLVLAPTNHGKSAIMGAIGSNQILQGKNVLYVTLEMSEEMISQRIMANIFNIEQDSLTMTDKTTLMKKYEKIRPLIEGRFRVKNFSSGEASCNRIRKLIKEYKTKANFNKKFILLNCFIYKLVFFRMVYRVVNQLLHTLHIEQNKNPLPTRCFVHLTVTIFTLHL